MIGLRRLAAAGAAGAAVVVLTWSGPVAANPNEPTPTTQAPQQKIPPPEPAPVEPSPPSRVPLAPAGPSAEPFVPPGAQVATPTTAAPQLAPPRPATPVPVAEEGDDGGGDGRTVAVAGVAGAGALLAAAAAATAWTAAAKKKRCVELQEQISADGARLGQLEAREKVLTAQRKKLEGLMLQGFEALSANAPGSREIVSGISLLIHHVDGVEADVYSEKRTVDDRIRAAVDEMRRLGCAF